MTQISFDQYQRYNNVANIVNRLRENNETFRILEVGANEHQNLESFLPKDTIYYLDIELPEQLLNNSKYILGDATEMTFPDNSFDVVVALDVFEHIIPSKRDKFIDELYRVSSQFFVVTAPFHSPKVVEAEKRVNNIFKSFFNKDYIWLEEHILNGLPKQDKLEHFLNSKGIPYHVLSHGNIDIWEKIMGIHFVTVSNPTLLTYRQEIDEYYNNYLFEYDFSNESYRKIFIIGKGRDIDITQDDHPNEIPQDKLSKLNELEDMFYRLASLLNPRTEVIQQKVFEENMMVQDRIQVFVNDGLGFNEEESYILDINKEQLLSHFSVEVNPNHSPVTSIRIDPSNYPGGFSIKNVKIFDAEGNSISQYKVSGNFSFSYLDLFIYEKEDPMLILDFDSEIKVKSLELDILRVSSDFRLLGQEFKNIIFSQEEQNNQTSAENKKLKHLLSELTAEKNEVLMSLQQTKNEVNQQRTEIVGLAKKLKATENTNALEIREINEQLILKQKELDNIYNSSSWKFLERLRKFFVSGRR
ncbi:class I SAM-dependent methyltransferase [Paenibacillus caui]|uniref:class I SAM-dependent methyltransferase n=1 Tax=Paenibacillus caui TaxID=2873927 RepID=UPI001CA9C8A5|nr:class I SAM-dependent methyltransferase [Paenibacillus caui]